MALVRLYLTLPNDVEGICLFHTNCDSVYRLVSYGNFVLKLSLPMHKIFL